MENKEAKAYLRYVRIAPRKIQIVCDLIRGKDVGTAMHISGTTASAVSASVSWLIRARFPAFGRRLSKTAPARLCNFGRKRPG